MNISYYDLLVKVLTIIGYTDDKESFAKAFIAQTEAQTLSDLIQSLPSDAQEKVKSDLMANTNDTFKQQEILANCFSQEERNQAYEKTAKEAIHKWLEAIDSSLIDTQRQNLDKLAQEYNPITDQQ